MRRNGSATREGVVVGLIGYAAVAVFYAVFDLLAGRGGLFTLNLLGKIVFGGNPDPSILQLPIPIDAGAMMAYNVLHLVVSLAVGLFVAHLVAQVEQRPRIGVPVLLVLLSGYAVTVAVVAVVTQEVAPLLPFWSIVTVNTLAALAGGVFLWRAHPHLWARVLAVPTGG